MKRMVLRLLPAVVTLVLGGGVGAMRYLPPAHHEAKAGQESREAEQDNSPGDSDYWTVLYGYNGDAQNLHFQSSWLLDAKQDDMRIASAVPAGRKALRAKSALGAGLDPNAFTFIGPLPLQGGVVHRGNNAGRVNTILTDPDNPSVAWIGSDGGGIWKTTNCCSATTAWTVKTDLPEISSIAIGDLTMDPVNHDVLYASTGDMHFTGYSFGAVGVLKSTDRGETWSLLGTDVFNPRYTASGGFPQYQAISKVVVDPNRTTTLIVSTKTGVYFSYDAGSHWAGPCYTNGFSSQRQDVTGLVAVNRSGITYLYAGVGTRGAPTAGQPDLGNNGANGVYRTTVPTSGCPAIGDWTPLLNGFPSDLGTGTPSALGRLELAAAPSDPLTLYAMFADADTGGVRGVWRTNDGGDTWTEGGAPSSANAGYNAGVTVSPTNPSTLFVSVVDLFRSDDGGKTFVNLTQAATMGPYHPDNHARAVVGGDANHVLNGTDGGMYYISNALTATNAATLNWTALNDTLPTTEMYNGDITANFATASSGGAAAGFQDNGSATIVFNGTPTAGLWIENNGGDGPASRIEPVFGQIWYSSVYFSLIYASTTGPSGKQQPIFGPLDSTDRAVFLTPFDLYRYGDLNVPGSGCDAVNGCNHLVLGTQRVWESTDGGLTSWAVRTGDVTKNNLILGSDNRSYINQIHYSVSDPSVAIVGTNDGNVQYVFDLGGTGAATAVDVTGGNVVLPNRPMMDVATDPLNPLIGYAAVGGFSAGTPATPGHVLQVSCSQRCASFTWLDKSGNLPDIPAKAVIANPHLPHQVFVGTDWGLYYTDDIRATAPVWQRFETLPHAMVWSLNIDRGFTTLAAFTRSRGAWVWPLPSAASGSADLEVRLAYTKGKIEPGHSFHYAVSVTNHGPNDASNVLLSSTLPPGVTFVANSGDCTSAYPCAFPSIASGATEIIDTVACVPSRYAGPNPIVVLGAASSDMNDPASTNNSASVDVPLLKDWVFGNGFDACP